MGRSIRIASRLLVAITLTAGTLFAAPDPAVVSAGDPPRPQPDGLLQGDGETFVFRDQTGTEVWAVNSGWDLHQYLFRDASPLNFAIDVDRTFGPVDVDGHPAPGNALFGLTGRVSLRVFDVDDDAPIDPEVDEVYVNGFPLGTLSGADDQWSVNTFEFPLSQLRLPTSANPAGRNDFWIDIDTTNSGWAVELNLAALRLKADEVPLTFVHGLTSSGGTWTDFRDYVDDNSYLDAGQMATPTHASTNIESDAAEIAPAVYDMMFANGAVHTNVIAHSYGGLVARLYAWDNPSLVDNLILIGAPNGGGALADALCLFKNSNGPWAGPIWLAELADDALGVGDCRGPQDALFQLQTDYVQNTFNVQVPDRNGTRYATISGIVPDEGRLYDLIPGADDGLVSLDSSQYLWSGRADHPGKHLVLDALPLEHGALIRAGSDAMPISVCWLYGTQCGVASPSVQGEAVTSSPDFVLGKFGAVEVPAGATGSITLAFEGQAEASVVLISDHIAQISPNLSGASFQTADMFGSNVLAARLVQPSDGEVQITNGGSQPARVIALVGVPAGRALEVTSGGSLVQPASAVGISVTLTGAGVGEAVSAEVTGPSGSSLPVALSETSPGLWTGSVTPTESGVHSVTAWVDGARPRYDSTLLTVSSGNASLTGAFTEALEAGPFGLSQSLIISPTVAIAAEGRYRLSAELADDAGHILASAGTVEDLTAGTVPVELTFSGRAIFESGEDGPFRIVNVALSRDETGIVLEDRADYLGLTGSYSHTAFDHFPVAFDLDGFTDDAVDIDADGIDDELRVQGSVAVDAGGSYAINARLVAPDGTEIGEFQTTTQLVAGSNALNLIFDGSEIAAAGMDGPYILEDLSVYSLSNADILGYLVGAHKTDAYTAAQFGTLPTVALNSASARFLPPGPCDPFCPLSPAEGTVTLAATGDASTQSGLVTVEYRLWGSPPTGDPVLLVDWTAATPSDGAFDSSSEGFRIDDSRDNTTHVGYQLDVRATSGGASSTISQEVPIEHDTIAPASSVDALPANTTTSPYPISMTVSDNWSAPNVLVVDVWYRYRKAANQAWGAWAYGLLSDSTPPYSANFSFPNGKGFYEFYSIATDQSGNVEAPPASADAWIQKK